MDSRELRLKCVEIVMPSATKINLSNGEILLIAEQVYKFVMTPDETPKAQPAKEGAKGK